MTYVLNQTFAFKTNESKNQTFAYISDQ